MKKGFIFIETIVTLTILMSTLIVLYAVFINLLQKKKAIAEYDTYGDVTALYYYKNKESISKGTFPNMTEDIYHLNSLVVFSCEDTNRTILRQNYLSKEFLEYVKQYTKLSCPKSTQKFILLGEFKYDDKYTYAHIFAPNY